MSDKDHVQLGERSWPLVVKQIGDETTRLGAPDIDLPNELLPEGITEGQSVRLTVMIESRHTRNEWSRAYAKQGASDLEVYKVLSKAPGITDNHLLHYLQMAGEKIAKAYQFRHTHKRIDALLSHHVALPDFIKDYCQSNSMKARYEGREAQLRAVRQDLSHLAVEIEKLAPAVDRDKAPTNAEYPWTNGVTLTVPCEYTYPIIASIPVDVWRNFVQTLEHASAELIR